MGFLASVVVRRIPKVSNGKEASDVSHSASGRVTTSHEFVVHPIVNPMGMITAKSQNRRPEQKSGAKCFSQQVSHHLLKRSAQVFSALFGPNWCVVSGPGYRSSDARRSEEQGMATRSSLLRERQGWRDSSRGFTTALWAPLSLSGKMMQT